MKKPVLYPRMSGKVKYGGEVPRRFWCHWLLPGDEVQRDRNGREIVDDVTGGACCFNHSVGLPERQWDGTETIRVELTGFNLRMMENYHKYRKYSMNKCRGSGATEVLTIRWMVFKYGVLRNPQKCIIMPGTSSKLSNEISLRVRGVCDRIPQIYHDIPQGIKPTEFRFRGGGRIVLTSATPDAVRGWEGIGDIVLEEVAHWDMVDDMPVYYATEGVHEKTRCHVVHSTTPYGRRGFYYDLVWSPEATSDYFRHVVNWREILGLPVMRIEDLEGCGPEDVPRIREECLTRFGADRQYREWYVSRFDAPIGELVQVPVPILDMQAIVADARTHRPHYDQEMDNEFLASSGRAIGDIMGAEIEPDELE